MGLEVWYPTDIRNALLAAEQATVQARGDAAGDDYLEGYRAALTTLALFFGLVTTVQPEADDVWRPVALDEFLEWR